MGDRWQDSWDRWGLGLPGPLGLGLHPVGHLLSRGRGFGWRLLQTSAPGSGGIG